MATIDAVAVAASASAAIGGVAGVGFSGAGADAINVILTKTNAYLKDSTVGTTATASAGDVWLEAKDESTIIAKIVAASAAVGVSAGASIGASIGVSIARNAIGWDLDGNGNPTVSNPAQVRAWSQDTSICSDSSA